MKNNKAILLLALANSISGVAQGISMLAIPWYFTGVIHKETLFGEAYFTITCISLLWGLYAGTLVDRYDRRKIFLVVNLVGFFILSSVAAFGFSQNGLPWAFVALVFATTALIYNIHFPNLYAFAQEITPKEKYGRITSLLEIQGQLTFTIAGASAAILLKGIDHHINFFGFDVVLPFTINAWPIYKIFALDAFTYLVSFIIIYNIRTLPVAERRIDIGSLQQRIKTGLSFLRRHMLLFYFGNASLFVFLTIIVFGTYVQPVYVDSFQHKGADVYAFADVAFSMGALLAGFLTTRIFTERYAVRGIMVLSMVAGVMYLCMAVPGQLLLFFVPNFIIGSCNAAVRIQRITYMFHHTPNRVIGRTNSIFFVINVFLRLCLIGLFTLPFFHRATNIVFAVVIMAAICFAGAGILGINYKRLMNQPEIT